LELSADQSFVAGKLPTGKRGRAPNDGKWNPLQTEKKKEKHACLERFLNECRKTKAKVTTLANHKEHIHASEPIKTQSRYTWPAQSSGKLVPASHEILVLVLLLIGAKVLGKPIAWCRN